MLHPFFDSRRPVVFAHRGGGALAPENTLAAFANGIALGADGFELDVHLSRDGLVVVHHDRTLDRTTTLGGEVAARSADELRRADVPTLAEVLKAHPDVRVIVELKVHSVEMAAAVVDVARRADAVDRVCVGSYGTRVLRAVRSFEPALATSASREEVRWALYRSWIPVGSGRFGSSRGAGGAGRAGGSVGLDRSRWSRASVRRKYDGFQIPESAGPTRVVSRRFIDFAHDRGLGVQVWTVDTEHDARRLIEWGVDGLITDRPDIIVPIVREKRISAL
ncbi:MAG TPA: glycerophosphodiester phosphodiesterase family protein [Vicinamibacterales bacterium]